MKRVFPEPIRNLPEVDIPMDGVKAFLSQSDSLAIFCEKRVEMKKIVVFLSALMFVFGIVGIAHCDLVIIGTANYLGSDYNLIYEDDSIDGGLVWLDYTRPGNTWQNQVSWASGLSFTEPQIQLNGYTSDIDWSKGWRLPLTQDPTAGYNQTGSEMGHLYYVSLGKPSGGPLGNTAPFVNLQDVDYWSSTEYASTPGQAWGFRGHDGYQSGSWKVSMDAARAVHAGTVSSAPVPDADDDGVPDENDNCVNDPNPNQTDSDNDDVGDACDECPNDPGKIESGVCGCGTPDTDTDNDLVPDCIDNCPNDPNKINPGICGCGIADTDTDQDGKADCNDDCNSLLDTDGDGVGDCDENCPNDPDKTEPGVCGCGLADTDTDNDGTPDCIDFQIIANIISPASNQKITVGKSVNFQCAVVGGNPPFTYSWNFDGAADNSTQKDPGDVIFAEVGTYTVVLAVADDDGDIDSDTVTITVKEESDGGGGGGGGGGCLINSIR